LIEVSQRSNLGQIVGAPKFYRMFYFAQIPERAGATIVLSPTIPVFRLRRPRVLYSRLNGEGTMSSRDHPRAALKFIPTPWGRPIIGAPPVLIFVAFGVFVGLISGDGIVLGVVSGALLFGVFAGVRWIISLGSD
jgi:hypothetical protein